MRDDAGVTAAVACNSATVTEGPVNPGDSLLLVFIFLHHFQHLPLRKLRRQHGFDGLFLQDSRSLELATPDNRAEESTQVGNIGAQAAIWPGGKAAITTNRIK